MNKLKTLYPCDLELCLKPVSHCPIITESAGTQLVVRSYKICSDCFGRSFLSHCLTVKPNF